MEIKKTKAVDLEGKRTTWFLLGLVFVLSVIFVSFEYTANDETTDIDGHLLDELEKEVELIPVTKQQQNNMIALTPPKLRTTKKPSTKIKVVDNTSEAQGFLLLSDETSLQEGVIDGDGGIMKQVADDQTQALSPVATDMNGNQQTFRIVEDLPQFPGGAVELMKWLTNNLRYPTTAQRQKIQGKVVVQFIVNRDGNVSDIKVIKSLNPDCDREALRVVRMMPKWKPGVQHDKPCRTMVCIPIIFKLN